MCMSAALDCLPVALTGLEGIACMSLVINYMQMAI